MGGSPRYVGISKLALSCVRMFSEEYPLKGRLLAKDRATGYAVTLAFPLILLTWAISWFILALIVFTYQNIPGTFLLWIIFIMVPISTSSIWVASFLRSVWVGQRVQHEGSRTSRKNLGKHSIFGRWRKQKNLGSSAGGEKA